MSFWVGECDVRWRSGAWGRASREALPLHRPSRAFLRATDAFKRFPRDCHRRCACARRRPNSNWWAFEDSKIAGALFRIPFAKKVGEDHLGNTYYEKLEGVQYGRDRFVVYKDVEKGTEYYSTSVPPEWHAWMTHMNYDKPPPEMKLEQPSFGEEYAPLTVHGWGGEKRYGDDKMLAKSYWPKGSAMYAKDGKVRRWQKVEAWKPN